MPFNQDCQAYTSYFQNNCAFYPLVHHIVGALKTRDPDFLPYMLDLCQAVSNYYNIGKITPQNLKDAINQFTHPVDHEKFLGPVLRSYLASLIEQNSNVQKKVVDIFKQRVANYFANPQVPLEHIDENLFQVKNIDVQIKEWHQYYLDRHITEVSALDFLNTQPIDQYFRNNNYYSAYAHLIAEPQKELSANDVAYLYDNLGFNLEWYGEADIKNDIGNFPLAHVTGHETITVLFLGHGHFDYEAASKEISQEHNSMYDAANHEPTGETKLDNNPSQIQEQTKQILEQVMHPKSRQRVPTVPAVNRTALSASGHRPTGTGRAQQGPANYVSSCYPIVPNATDPTELEIKTTESIDLEKWRKGEELSSEAFGYHFQLSSDYGDAKINHWVRPVKIGDEQYNKDDFVVDDINDPANLVGALRLISESFTEVSLDHLLKDDRDVLVRAWAVANTFELVPTINNEPVKTIDQLVGAGQNAKQMWQRVARTLYDLNDTIGNKLVSEPELQSAKRKFDVLPHTVSPTLGMGRNCV